MTEAYPLRWPDGWPKTAAAKRDRGHQFKQGNWNNGGGKSLVTWSRARKLILEELVRLKAGNIVISSSIDVRVDGTPRSGINADSYTLKEPGVALYFTLKGRPMVMAQDAYDNPAANLRSLGLAIEAMRSLERHGGGTMMQRAFDGFAALPAPDGVRPKRPWWIVLNYGDSEEARADASVEEIEARFKSLARKRHPDTDGGSTEAMSELNIAREEAVRDLGG